MFFFLINKLSNITGGNMHLRKIKRFTILFFLIGAFLANPSKAQSGEHPQDPSVTRYAIPGILYQDRLEFYRKNKIPWEKATPEQQQTFLKEIGKVEVQKEKQSKLLKEAEEKRELKEDKAKELAKKKRIQNNKKIERDKEIELEKRHKRLEKEKKEMMKKIHKKRVIRKRHKI